MILSPDRSIPKEWGGRDHTYLPFHSCLRGSETVAMTGTQTQPQRFAEAGVYFYIYSKVEPIAQNKGEKLKQELFERCWRPEAFKQ